MTSSLTNAQVWTRFSGSSYDSARPPYPSALVGHLLQVHRQTAGLPQTAVDLGCGPGTVTRQLAPHFETVHGVDISSEMYSSAIPQPNVQYRTGSSSDLSFLADGSVDLITAGTSAHWFDWPSWWAEMSRVVRPSGSVAVFTFNPGFILDTSAAMFTPPSLKELIDSTRLYSGPFAPFRTAGNAHTFQLYDHLPGPVDQQGWEPAHRWRWGWKGKEDYGAVGQWDWEVQETKDGAPEIEKDMESEMTLGELATYFASVSPVLKYRAALAPGQPDWIVDKLAAITAEGKAHGEDDWGHERKVKVRRVFGLVVWKRSA